MNNISKSANDVRVRLGVQISRDILFLRKPIAMLNILLRQIFPIPSQYHSQNSSQKIVDVNFLYRANSSDTLQPYLVLQMVSSKMKCPDYICTFKRTMTSFLNEHGYSQQTFQKDNARIHIIREIRARFSAKGINILEYSSFFADLNQIENLRLILIQKVNANHRQFSTIKDFIQFFINKTKLIKIY